MLERDCVAAPLDDDERVEALGDLRDTYDGHSTPEKYARVRKFIEEAS